MRWLTLAAGVVATLGTTAALAWWWLRRNPILSDDDVDRIIGEAFEDLDKTWTPDVFPGTGRLPMSTKMSGSFVRWHRPELYWRGVEFWKTFQDGPWKWKEQQRYAGAGENCGHYFSVTEAGATAEAAFYQIDVAQRRLLTAHFECDAILDLTYETHLVEIARLAISNWREISDRHFLVTILSMQTDSSKGGVPFTDFVGHWASREGYDGILFFGARALTQHPDLKLYIDTGADDGMAGPVVHGYFREMRQRDDLKNLVIFSGARLTSAIAASQLRPDPPDVNPYFGATAETIDRVVEFTAEFQEEQAGKGFYLAQPFSISE